MSAETPSTGYAPPRLAPYHSHAAAAARAAALLNDISGYQLRRPKTVIDQRDLPSCVSCALSAALEVLRGDWPRLAPLFHYYVTRFENGGSDARGFLYLWNSLATLDLKGICRHSLHQVPFDETGIRTKPTPEAYADARRRAFNRWDFFEEYVPGAGLSRSVWIREQLRQERPVVMGFQLPARYPDTFLNHRHQWLDPNTALASSGHCVLVLGYDDSQQALFIQDSRGEGVFDRGCWWMGYRVADGNRVVQEVYSLVG